MQQHEFVIKYTLFPNDVLQINCFSDETMFIFVGL